MNERRYRLIYSEVHGEYIPVPEMTSSHICVIPGCSGSRAFPVSSPVLTRILKGLVVGSLALSPGLSQSIVTDGRTQTAVTTTGSTTNITTGTVRNTNAFNSFSVFNVNAGNTVNLYLPGGTQNLINIVRDQRTDIYGILNAYKDGHIGGNVWFANPYGFVVGAGGVVNVGSLNVSTPTKAFVDRMFSAPGIPDDEATAQLLAGTAPRGPGEISIQGRINALGGINLSAGLINVGGTLFSGARFIGDTPGIETVVNVNGLDSASNIIEAQGRIQIVADGDVNLSGTLAAPGGSGVSGGTIDVEAGNDVNVLTGANLSARGNGQGSNGGNIKVWGGNNATFQAGALINATAGGNGNGGAIEFSARNLVSLQGGRFLAGSNGGRAGSILIDPTYVEFTGPDWFTDGADLTIDASKSITLDNIVISTRQVAAGDADRDHIETGASTGNSGNLILEAPTISLSNGSKLLAQADNGHLGGSITLSAVATNGLPASITLAGSTLKGDSLSLSASSSYNPGVPRLLGAIPTASATVDVQDSTLAAAHGISLNTTSLVNSTVTGPTLSLSADASVAVNAITSTSAVHIGGNSIIQAGGALTLAATNTVTASTTADASGMGDAAIGGAAAVTEATTTTSAYADGATQITADSISASATSSNSLTTQAVAARQGATKQAAGTTSETETYLTKYKGQASTSEGNVGVAAALAVADLNATTQAYLASSSKITTNGAVVLSSQALNKSAVTADGTNATGGTGVGVAVGVNIGVLNNRASVSDGSDIQSTGLKLSATTPTGQSSSFTTDAKSGAGASNVGVAGSLAVNVLANTTVAKIGGTGSTTTVDAGGGAVDIEAGSNTLSTVVSGAQVTGSGTSAKVGVGASVGLNVAVNTTTAEVAGNAELSHVGDLTLDAEGTHKQTTTVTGGASGAQVSVTPAAAVTVAVDTTTAQLADGADLTIGGDYKSTAKQTADSQSSVTGTTEGSKVAVGASLSLTTAVDTVTSSVERNLTSTGGGVDVEASSVSKSAASATASASGGKATNGTDGSKPADGSATVDEQVGSQGKAASDAGSAADAGAKDKLTTSKQTPPSAKTSDGSVSVAAAIGVNVDAATTTAAIKGGKTVISTGALKVASQAETDGTAKADGSAVKADGSTTGGDASKVGVGAAVALNTAVQTNTATIGDGAHVTAHGVTVSATTPTGSTSTFEVDAKSGAGASNVGVAGSLAVNVLANTTVAKIGGTGSTTTVDAGGGAVDIEAGSNTLSTVVSGAKVTGSGTSAKVGVGASVGLNVAVNTTTAEVAGNAELSHVGDLTLDAEGTHKQTTTVTGGASGAQVSVTPAAAVTVAVDTTTAQLADGADLTIGGNYKSTAKQTADSQSSVTGTTEGSKVAVGASLSLTTAVDTVTSSVERNLTSTGGGVDVEASSVSKSAASATASASGGKATNGTDGSKPADGSATVDEQVGSQGKAASDAGSAADAGAKDKLTTSKQTPPSAKTSDGSVSVAAAIGVNVDAATTTAAIKGGKTVISTGALKVASQAETDGTAKADGSAVKADGSTTGGDASKVGVGAAVALNTAVQTNTATIGDGAHVTAHGVTVSATTPTGSTSTFEVDAKSGAGASNVGVAGSLAVNVLANTTVAKIGGTGSTTTVDAGGGAVDIEAGSKTSSKVLSSADVKGSGSSAKVGVGASVGVNAVVNTTLAEIQDGAVLSRAGDVTLGADGTHSLETSATGGAAGAKVSITPVAAVAVAVNTTSARLGTSSTALDSTGKLSIHASQTDAVTTTATGQASGDVAVGASLAATVALDHVTAELDRSVTTSTGIDLEASSDTALVTGATAGAKGAKAAPKDSNGADAPEAGTSVDDQKSTQLKSATGQNSALSSRSNEIAGKAPSADAPNVNKDENIDTKNPTGNKDSGSKKVSVAAAIGVGVAENQAVATTGTGIGLSTSGNLGIQASTDTNYRTNASGEAVSDNVGVAAAVALTATQNKTQATLGANSDVHAAKDITIGATASQNMDKAFLKYQAAQAISGASGGDVAVAGALAVVANNNETRASIDTGAVIGGDGTGTNDAPVGNVAVNADETSRLAAEALAGAISTGKDSKAGVGASFAVLLSNNKTTAAVGYGTDSATTSVFSNSLGVTATKHRIDSNLLDSFKGLTADNLKTKTGLLQLLDPGTYLSQRSNYYTAAVAGAAAKGSAAISGAFSVNVFGNTTEAYLGKANVTTGGAVTKTGLGVQVAASGESDAISLTGAVAAAQKAGVGISNTDIVNLDKTLATIGSQSHVTSTASGAGIAVNAAAHQNFVNLGVSAGIGTQNTGVAGVLGVVVSMNHAEALIGQGAVVKSAGNLGVEASNDSLFVNAAGGVAGGNTAGVGASIATNIVLNTTLATIGQDAQVDADQTLTVGADADETAVTAVVAGAGAGKVGVAGALSVNTILADTEATVAQGARLNANNSGDSRAVDIHAKDDTVVVGVSGGLAGGGQVGVGAAMDTTVLLKTVKAAVADKPSTGSAAEIHAGRGNVSLNAASTENLVSVTVGLSGGGEVGVGGAVSVAVNKNDVEARIGNSATVDAGGNVLVNAQDDTTAVLVAGAAAGGGNTGVGGSLAVATLLGTTKASIGDNATVNARGLGSDSQVYTGATGHTKEGAKGVSVTAYGSEKLTTTVASGAGGGTAGVAATVSGNVIASDTEATIGQDAHINADANGLNPNAGPDQQVRVKAVDETILTDTAGGAAGGGTAGVGAAANAGVIAKKTRAVIGKGAIVNAVHAVDLSAASQEVTVSTTFGLAGGGSAGVGGAVGAVGVANLTEAIIEDGTSSADGAKVTVTGGNSDGDLKLSASDLSTTTVLAAGGAGGGAAGVGGALALGVNVSQTRAKIGNDAVTNAAGITSVHANAVENVNTATIAGAGGGAAGVAGAISLDVTVSSTEAGIGTDARVNQTILGTGVDVAASDKIISVGAAGSGAGGGAAGVGGSANAVIALNTTSAYIDSGAQVSATGDVAVNASSEKDVVSTSIAGGGGGAAGVVGALSVVSVGSLLDGEATSGLQVKDKDASGKETKKSTQDYTDSQTTTGLVGKKSTDPNQADQNLLGSSKQASDTQTVLDSKSQNLAVGKYMGSSASIPKKNTQAAIGAGTTVKAGGNVKVDASDQTLVVAASGMGVGAGAAAVGGALGVVLLHDSAEACIASGATVDAKQAVSVNGTTLENVYNVVLTGSGAGAADVSGTGVVNVVTSDTSAYIGAASVNQDRTFATTPGQDVNVKASSASTIISAAGAGGGAGAASVGGVLNVDVLQKTTKAYIYKGAVVAATGNVGIEATSTENLVNVAASIKGAGAAAVSGVASATVVGNTTEAFIGADHDDKDKSLGATVDSDGNVKLSATDDTLLVGVAAVGNGAGAAAVGGGVAANVITSQTRAFVSDHSSVDARGNLGTGMTVYTGELDGTKVGTLPSVPGKGSSKLDIDQNGTNDGDLSSGSISLSGSDGNSQDTSNGIKGTQSASAAGGLAAKATTAVKGLSVAAVSNEKIVSTILNVAGSGAASVTGAASVDVIKSQTEASIGNHVAVNQGGGAIGDRSVHLAAADHTLLVQVGGSVGASGIAGVSGSANVGVIAKQTTARIGTQSAVNAGDLSVQAISSEKIDTIGANVALGSAAGVGGAVNVDYIQNETNASIGTGAQIQATGDLTLHAKEDTTASLYTVSGSGGTVGVSGAVSVAVVDNTTKAYVEGSSSDTDATVVNAAGMSRIKAESTETVDSTTVSGAGGGIGIAGAVAVKVAKSDTEAFIGAHTLFNKNNMGGTSQGLDISASDAPTLKSLGGSGAAGALAGVGATAEINLVRDTTAAYLGDSSWVEAGGSVGVNATSTKLVDSKALAGSFGGSFGIAGAVNLAFVGAALDSTAQGNLGNGKTASSTDTSISTVFSGNSSGKSPLDNLGTSSHTKDMKTEIGSDTTALSVSGDLATPSDPKTTVMQNATQAYVGNSATVHAKSGITVAATDKTQANLVSTGAGACFVGVGGAIGVAVNQSTTSAHAGTSASLTSDAGVIQVTAGSGNVSSGSTVESLAGAGGIVGVSASVAVLSDNSTTTASLGDKASVQGAGSASVLATTNHASTASAKGASLGALAIGASVASSTFNGKTAAFTGDEVKLGTTQKLVSVEVSATDTSTGLATAKAGTAGVAAGSGAVATTDLGSEVDAHLGNSNVVNASGRLDIKATATPKAEANAFGVNLGYLGAVGASVATATSHANVHADIGGQADLTASDLTLQASHSLGADPAIPTVLATATGASGGLLLGANATAATASSTGRTTTAVGNDSTLAISGTTQVLANSNSQQTASALGISGGFVALGADVSQANSDTFTQTTLGDRVKITGATLQVKATGHDTNYAYSIAGSGGVVSAPFSLASTSNTSHTYVWTGAGNNTTGNARKFDVGTFEAEASHQATFDSWINNTNASLIGVSGAKASNTEASTTELHLGTGAYIEADGLTVNARNDVTKGGLTGNIPGLSIAGQPVAAPSWNVISNSGGLVDAPAAESLTTISNKALVDVGAGAHLEQTGSKTAPGSFAFDASNRVQALDRVKMSSGGAISAASGRSAVLADTNDAKVYVGTGATLSSLGDMALGACSTGNISTAAAVDVYGAVGVAPYGETTSRFKAVQMVDIGPSAILDSGRDVTLEAGSSSAGIVGSVSAVAHSDVFNNTAIPVSRDPVADAVVDTQSQISLEAGAKINAVRDVLLGAEKGTTTLSGVGIGKDLYREALAAVADAISKAFGGGPVSFETRTGRNIKSQTADVSVEGEVHVGTKRTQELTIGLDGTVTSATGSIHVTKTDVIDIAADIVKRIDTLKQMIKDFSVGTASGSSSAAVAVEAYKSEIKFLEQKLAELGVDSPDKGIGSSAMSPLAAATESLNAMRETRDTCASTKQGLTTQNTNLETRNTNLTTQNTNLGTQNTSLASQNTTLTNTNKDLAKQQTDLDPQSSTYQADYDALQAQINTNTGLINQNLGTIAQNNETVRLNGLEFQANLKQRDLNTAQIDVLTQRIVNLEGSDGKGGQIEQLRGELAGLSDKVSTGPIAKVVTISDATAQLGNIYVRGDRLHGEGVLDAPGNAAINITNNGPTFLILKNLTIPSEDGGKVYFNSVDVQSNDQINGVNGSAGGATFKQLTTAQNGSGPQIYVKSTFSPLDTAAVAQLKQTSPDTPPLAPDIILQGDVTNLRGSVTIDSAAGNIRLEQKTDDDGNLLPKRTAATISANTVKVSTLSGDFTQSYTDSFYHAAGTGPLTIKPGDPKLAYPGNLDSILSTPEKDGAGIFANGSVFIAARYLNINGTVQSGLPEWGVDIASDAQAKVGSGSMSFADAQAYYNGLSTTQKAQVGAEYFDVTGANITNLGTAQTSWTQIPVRYNAKLNQLELTGMQVQGGYIELYGQIFNTNAQGGGKLNVLDGYGQVKVNNQTSLPIMLNTLDTGRGVQGKINITNITGVDSAGRPILTTQSFVRDSGASRTGYTYNPTTGLRYAVSVGYDKGEVDFYRMSHDGWFDIPATFSQEALDTYRINSVKYDANRSYDGEFLGLGSAMGLSDALPNKSDDVTTSSVLTEGRSWTTRHWWSLWTYATYYREFTISSTVKHIDTQSVRADNPISINFIGFDQGKVDVNSAGNVVLGGSVYNRNGNTTITSSGGSITQNGNLAILGGNHVSLDAATGIGTSTQALLVNVKSTGKLDALSDSGDVRIGQVVGDLHLGNVGGAGVSTVALEADRNLLNFDATSSIEGNRVELISRNAGIGTLGDPLNVRTGYTTNQLQWAGYGLKAGARDSIYLKNSGDAAHSDVYSGNLLLVSADSAAGDVRIETTGTLIDNNPYETKDERTEAELANLWDALALRGPAAGEKADQAVTAFEKGRNNNYKLYWLIRGTQPDGGTSYDPNYQYKVSATEADALTKAGEDVASFEKGRTDLYHQLNREVGGFTGAYNENFAYTATPAERAQISKGSSWTDAQLELPVSAGLLKEVTDTVTTIKAPNAHGRNVTLIAGTGIGSFNDPLTIDLSKGLSSITTEQKAALAAAERGDTTNVGSIITVRRTRPVNVTVGTGALDADAGSGLAFLGSEEDLRIDQVAATGEIRIKTAGSLINGASTPGTVNVRGAYTILEAGNGGIGSATDGDGHVSTSFLVGLSNGSGLTARSAGDMWLEGSGDTWVDTLYSRGDVRLDAQGSILDFQLDGNGQPTANNILGTHVTLNATGAIGTWENPLDLGVRKAGFIQASGRGVFLNGPAGQYFTLHKVTSLGDLLLASEGDMKIDGEASATGGSGTISIAATGLVDMTTRAYVHAPAANFVLDAGALTMADDGSANARIQVEAGTIDLTTEHDATVTGISTGNGTQDAINITSTAGHILAGHLLGSGHLDIIADTAPAARLTMRAALGIGDEPLNVRLLNLQATSGGKLDLNATGSVNLVGTGLQADGRVLFTSGGSITGTSVTGQGDVSLRAQDSIQLGSITAGSGLVLGSDRIATNVFGISQPIQAALGGFNGGSATSVNLTLSSPTGFDFSQFNSHYATVSIPSGWLQVDSALIGDRAIFSNPSTQMLVDQHSRTAQSSDVQVYSFGRPFSLWMNRNRVDTDAFVVYRDPWHEALAPSGLDHGSTEHTEDALTRSNSQTRQKSRNEEPEFPDTPLITYAGIPVSMEGE